MTGAQPRCSPVEVSRPTMLVVDADRQLDQSLKNVIQEFKLSLAVWETSSRDVKLCSVDPSPDVVLVNLSASKACLELLPEMQQLWPRTRVIVVSE
jgi:DNA-binding NtrC family response regulator